MALFKEALKLYGIQRHFDYKYIKNDKIRCTAICKRDCGWQIHASHTYFKDVVQIKAFNSTHQCGAHHKNTKLDYKFTAAKYLECIRDNPNMPPTALGGHIRRDFYVSVSKNHMYRAKKLALDMIYGRHADQYKYVYDYCEALSQRNPGTCLKVCRDGQRFQRIYVRLDACKRGFLAGCRPLIVLDGCHLKGPFGGQLLCAVGKDANDDMYPIAFAVCEVERRCSWTWFLELLVEDIGIDDSHAWTWMSDRQKGLRESLEALVPSDEQRHGVRHLQANLKTEGYRGKQLKDVLWRAVRSCTESNFKRNMDVLKGINPNAYAYLEKVDPKGWSKHAFRTSSKSDILLSNIAETFNGIPCAHTCAAIYADRLVPEDFVDNCYRKEAYLASYSPVIHSMPGAEDWSQSESGQLLPPEIRTMPGRPKKARVRAADEAPDAYHLTRKGLPVRCGKCLVVGHNARSCKKPDNPNRRIYPKKPLKRNHAPQNADSQLGPATTAPKQRKRKKNNVSQDAGSQPGPATTAPEQRKRKKNNVSQDAGSQPGPSTTALEQRKSKRNSASQGGLQPSQPRRSPRKKGPTGTVC